MKKYYFDANALIKYYKKETGSEKIDDLIENAKPILISRLTFLETIGVLAKFTRKKLIREKDLMEVIESLRRNIGKNNQIRSFQMIPISDNIFQLAEAILLENLASNIQTNDALHLAIVKNLESQAIMVTSDGAMENVCSQIDVESYNPETEALND